MLTRRAATEVAARDDKDLRLAVLELVEDKVGLLAAVGVVTEGGEEGDSETGPLNGLEEAGGAKSGSAAARSPLISSKLTERG